MVKLLNFFLFLLFILLVSLFTSSKVGAQTCSSTFPPYLVGSDPCAYPMSDPNCGPPDITCQVNPFCEKFTGTQCCTTAINNEGRVVGGLGYDYCQSNIIPPGTFGAGSYAGFQCCYSAPTPTPTPPCSGDSCITPTPTQQI